MERFNNKTIIFIIDKKKQWASLLWKARDPILEEMRDHTKGIIAKQHKDLNTEEMKSQVST